jgi:hypothetical protein
MAVTVPDHDTLITHIQNFVIEAVDKHGWPDVREICEHYDVSPTLLRRIYLVGTQRPHILQLQEVNRGLRLRLRRYPRFQGQEARFLNLGPCHPLCHISVLCFQWVKVGP